MLRNNMRHSSFPRFLILFLIFFPSSSGHVRTPLVQSKKSTRVSVSSWQDFHEFQDARRGNLVHGISKLKKYFARFGYLEPRHATNATDLFDIHLETAVARYQEKLGLSVTGKLDSPTLSQLMAPRCGVPDVSKTASRLTERFAYFAGRLRWGRSIPMTLTYAISPTNRIGSPSMRDVRSAFRRAFRHWASVIPVTFVEGDDYGFADIKIGFYSGDHGDGEAFDGVLGVLAHAFSPESGRFHLDAAETWAVDFGVEKSEVAVDLESVATHEIGHLLGLGHSSVTEAVMYPSLKPREKKVDLKVDDVKGVQALYGSNPNFSFQALSESYVSSTAGFQLERKVVIWIISLAVLILYLFL